MTRRLSHWGWGWAHRFPRRTKRLALAAQMRVALGFGLGFPRNPRPLDDADVSAPRVDLPEALRHVTTDDARERVRHAYGRSYVDLVRGFYGTFDPVPDLVAQPTSEEEVRQVLAWADQAGVAVVPYGGGTNVVRALECAADDAEGVLSLDLRGLDRVLEVDDVSLTARIQAGATGPRLESQLEAHGLTLRHFPQSFEFSTLGGWIATRSGGHFATGFTHIDDFVQSLRVLTPVGLCETAPVPASGAGPSVDRLLLGSEGTLGVITDAWMRVRRTPNHRSKANVFFEQFDHGVDAVRAIAQSGLWPSNCRLLDENEARLHRVTENGRCVLILGFEGHDLEVSGRLDQALSLALRHGGRCPDGPEHRRPGEGESRGDAAGAWKRAFFEAPYLQNSLVSLGVLADTFETSCTWGRFPQLHEAIHREVGGALRRLCGKGLVTCRFTHAYPDGPAPYYTFLGPVKRGAEVETWQEIKHVASETLHAHGGTITHHHAVGRTHRAHYLAETPEPILGALRAAKKAVDPSGILNPGTLFS